MNKAGINLQDVFLNQVRKDRLAVTVYMTNGFQLKGYVRGFDNFTVVLDSDGKQQMIYKHAISTVSPVKPVNLIFADNASHSHGQRPHGQPGTREMRDPRDPLAQPQSSQYAQQPIQQTQPTGPLGGGGYYGQ